MNDCGLLHQRSRAISCVGWCIKTFLVCAVALVSAATVGSNAAGGVPAPPGQTSVYDVVRGWVPELSTPSRLQRWWPHWELPHWGLQPAGSPSPGAWPPSRASGALHSAPDFRQRSRQKLEALIGVSVPQPADDIDLTRVLWENLAEDVRFWRQRPKSTIGHQMRLAQHKLFSDRTNVRRLVLIQDNKVLFPLMDPGQQEGCVVYCDPQMRAFMEGMTAAVNVHNISFPDMLFLLNVDDNPPCLMTNTAPPNECSVPLLSLARRVDAHVDILGPPLLGPDAHDVVERSLPWDQKTAKAFFRGVPSCGRSHINNTCARTWFARLASTNHSDKLDAGLIDVYFRPDQIELDSVLQDGHGPLPVLPRTDLSMLPRYRYLLNLDGHVAPYRTALLLATNSVMLKQHSPWMEWYYRSLHPWAHFIPIMKSSKWDAFKAMQWVDTHQEEAQLMTRRAVRFALRYTTFRARLLYWMYALRAYKALFEDQEELLTKLRGLGDEERRQMLLRIPPPDDAAPV